ncbi:MAG: bifunctional 4-hydroxy-2-oxoglutarate aldolase/2-dehydro-3-deoxy-phosphogluconate aldolase [Bosea sp. (in: a-proteobacteria)]
MSDPVAGPVSRFIACSVIPVVQLPDVESAEPLARALLAGGIDAIEITLRNPAGLGGIHRVADALPDMLVIAGTVLTAKQITDVASAGAKMAVSPGFSADVAEAARGAGLPWLPGVATASDCMAALGFGIDLVKFFPAEQAGGPAMLKALGGPFPQLRFCPTGGVTEANMAGYFATGTVVAVGGSWIAPTPLIAAKDWPEITRRAAQASQVRNVLRAPR